MSRGKGETLESPLDCKDIKPVNPKGTHSWMFIGRTDAEAAAPILWPPELKNWLFGKDPDAGKDWRREEKGMTENEMVGWHHRLEGHGFEQALGVGDGQGSLVCCSPWSCKESTERQNWTELNWLPFPKQNVNELCTFLSLHSFPLLQYVKTRSCYCILLLCCSVTGYLLLNSICADLQVWLSNGSLGISLSVWVLGVNVLYMSVYWLFFVNIRAT